jgi:hypothetical protein
MSPIRLQPWYGRSVYTPLYEGAYWDVQNVMLEDVDRIEVILVIYLT